MVDDMQGNRKGYWKSVTRWDHVPKWFKKMRSRMRRAQDRDALRHEEEIPKHKKDNQYDWF